MRTFGAALSPIPCVAVPALPAELEPAWSATPRSEPRCPSPVAPACALRSPGTLRNASDPFLCRGPRATSQSRAFRATRHEKAGRIEAYSRRIDTGQICTTTRKNPYLNWDVEICLEGFPS
jgi:hypothetical protein